MKTTGEKGRHPHPQRAAAKIEEIHHGKRNPEEEVRQLGGYKVPVSYEPGVDSDSVTTAHWNDRDSTDARMKFWYSRSHEPWEGVKGIRLLLLTSCANGWQYI